jgi:hypothetical protein
VRPDALAFLCPRHFSKKSLLADADPALRRRRNKKAASFMIPPVLGEDGRYHWQDGPVQ